MKIYAVGGAVRDGLLGLPVQDRDYVVVGGTPQVMLDAGYRPVGRDFPVFLHPVTHEEYALARTERKTAAGYHGFAFYAAADITLEQDLQRRDLTINAIAQDEQGTLIDPYGGQRDLTARVLRHVSPAFAEDPVRILRLARFAARFCDPAFTVAPETMSLMKEMVTAGEVDALVPERVWQEISRGLMERQPSRMFQILRECGALQRLLPELDSLWGVPQPAKYHPEIDTGIHTMLVVDYAASQEYSLPVRWAALLHDLGKGRTPPSEWPHHYGHEQRGVSLVEGACSRLKTPAECRDLAILAAREHGTIGRALELRAATVVDLIERSDGIRRPERFFDLLLASKADCFGRTGVPDLQFPQQDYLTTMLHAVRTVPTGEIAQRAAQKGGVRQIAQAIHQARVEAVKQHMSPHVVEA